MNTTHQRTAAILRVHNADRTIGSTVIKARRHADTVIIIDSGSTDGTVQVARDAGALVVSSDAEAYAEAHRLGAAILEELPPDPEPATRTPKKRRSVLNALLALVGQSRPLMFFGVPGVFLFLLGLVFGWLAVRGYEVHGQFAIGTALLAVLLTMLGIMALFTGIMLHSIHALLDDYTHKW
jgi:hypothetical protein